MQGPKVPVFRKGVLVEHVPPSVARVAVKNKDARILSTNPYQIELREGLEVCPRPSEIGRKKATQGPQEVITVRRQTSPMATKQNTQNTYRNPAAMQRAKMEFFKKINPENGGDGLVWVKYAAAGKQFIVQGETATGKIRKFPPIRGGDPICLSTYAPKLDDIENMQDIDFAFTRGVLKFLTTEEADAYFAKKGNLLKQSPSQLKQNSMLQVESSLYHSPIHDSEVDTNARIEDPEVYVSEEDIVHPMVLGIIAEIGPMSDPNAPKGAPGYFEEGDRLPAAQALSRLYELDEVLDFDSLEYIESRGYWPSVRNWAKAKKKEVLANSGMLPETDELTDAEAGE